MSHRQSMYATHHLSATREGGEIPCEAGCPDGSECVGGVCVDPLTGDPIEGEPETVITGERVRYRSGGGDLERVETGELVRRADAITGSRALLAIQEGDTVTLDPIDEKRQAIEDVEVSSVEPKQGRRGVVSGVVLRLESV